MTVWLAVVSLSTFQTNTSTWSQVILLLLLRCCTLTLVATALTVLALCIPKREKDATDDSLGRFYYCEGEKSWLLAIPALAGHLLERS